MPGKRFGDVEREQAYHAWKENQCSPAEAARMTGIAERTIQGWVRVGSWRERMGQEANAIVSTESRIARGQMARMLGTGAERMLSILEGGKDSDAIAAYNLLLRYTTGIVEGDATMAVVSIKEITSWREKSPEELRAMVSNSLASNVETSLEAKYNVKR